MSDIAAATSSIRQVPFFAKAPPASDVRVTGDFTKWGRREISLTGSRSGDGCALIPLKPGVHVNQLLIDGGWADHAEANLTCRKSVREPELRARRELTPISNKLGSRR